MCSSRDQNVAKINGRPVLQPTCNRVPSLLERRNSLKKASPKPKSPKSPSATNKLISTPSIDKISAVKQQPMPELTKKSSCDASSTLKRSDSRTVIKTPGSIATARREQVANLQAMRKLRTAHYGRTNSSKYPGRVAPIDSASATPTSTSCTNGHKRCDFVSPSSDPIYLVYHDEEWGVPVHDDKMLFELLFLTTAQVGSDWTSVLKKRTQFRDAFSGFDPETVAKYNERKVVFLCSEYEIELSQVRGAIDNANRILEIKQQFGSFDNYLWRFVNYKPLSTQYKSCQKIPVKTSKSEAISKDMIKRGFRFVGPAVIHSFMQAAGLTNDHLVTCPRHS